MEKRAGKRVGVLTSGGDAPGLNAAIRAFARTALDEYGMTVFGFEQGYKGLVENNYRELKRRELSGILTQGGTILGASREKPFKNSGLKKKSKQTAVEKIKENYRDLNLDCLVVLGGNGTNTTGYLLANEGIPVIGIPKTIDNDIEGTDETIGFDTALDIATEAIDRLHSTAASHNRVMVIEVMGHKAGWLTLYSGIAGGGDVILIPEIPYNIDAIAQHLKERTNDGKNFSIVVVAEGAISESEARLSKHEFKKRRKEMIGSIGYRVAHEIEKKTALDVRVTVLGYVQRGGIPSARDRLLATELGAAAAKMVEYEQYGQLVAMVNNKTVGIPLAAAADKTKKVPLTHTVLQTARSIGTCFGD